MARSMAFEDLATEVYVRVDDWYQSHAAGGRQGQAEAKLRFSDSEVITLLRLMDCLPFPGKTQFLGFVRAHHHSLFPQWLSQSQFNRRARPLWPWVEVLGPPAPPPACWTPSPCPWSATRATRAAATLRPRPPTGSVPVAP